MVTSQELFVSLKASYLKDVPLPTYLWECISSICVRSLFVVFNSYYFFYDSFKQIAPLIHISVEIIKDFVVP